jgi:hypothetical protein
MKTQPFCRLRLARPSLLTLCACTCTAATLSLALRASAITLKPRYCYEATDSESGAGSSAPRSIKIQVIENDPDSAKEVAWLGISTEEATDVLSAQLGLQPGDGLIVSFVQPDSPAAKAGLQKNDVLVEMGDQLLLHPHQFRKLVRRQKQGDKINLTLFRSGKKLSVAATLAKTTERAGNLEDAAHEFQVQVKDPKPSPSDAARENVNRWRNSNPYAGLVKQVVDVEVQRGVEEARDALNQALVRNHSFAMALGPEAAQVQEWTRGNVNVGQRTTITLKKNDKSARTIVKAEETGTFIIVAGPTKHLTVIDKDGKMLFDGDIETEAQQEKVPRDLWRKAEPILEELNATPEHETRPKANSTESEKH